MARPSDCAMVFVVVALQLLFTSSLQADIIDDYHPRNFNYTELSSRYVRLSWEHPKRMNGTQTGYRVRLYRPQDDRWIAVYKTEANSTNITVSCLTPNTSYKFALCVENFELCEKFKSNFTIQTLLDKVSEEDISFTSVIANWRAVLLGFGLTLICVFFLVGTIFVACKCYFRRKKSTQSQDDSVLRVRPWDHPTNGATGDRHYSQDPTSGKGLVNLVPDPSLPVFPTATTSSSSSPPRLPPPPPKTPSRFDDNGDDNCSDPPRVPSWPGSTCVSQNLEEIADLAVYQNEVFTSNGPAHDAASSLTDLPVYTNEMFDSQGSNDRGGRRHRRNQPVDLPVYGNYQF